MRSDYPAFITNNRHKFPAEIRFFKEPVPEKEQKCVSFDHSLCCFPLVCQELLEVVPNLSEFNFRILALKSGMFSSNKLGVGFVIDDSGIVSPVYDYARSER